MNLQRIFPSYILIALIACLLFGTVPVLGAGSNAESIEYVNGVVLSIQSLDVAPNKKVGISSKSLVTILLTSGAESGKQVQSINYITNQPLFDISPSPGDKIILAVSDVQNEKQYHIADYNRLFPTYILVGLFILSLLILGKTIGIKTIFVICFSIVIILKGMIPLILNYHWNFIIATMLVCAVITAITQITISGWNSKTWGAILGTVGGVVIAGVLAAISISWMHLTGLDSEEAMMLKVTTLTFMNFQEVLFAGIILGSLGAVMDVTISIASTQYEIKQSCPHYGFREIFNSGINVGRDVMGTMANTLILAYTGSSLPLVFLIASQDNVSFMRIMNLNIVATEITRALTGSIGLICSIPLTAVITAFLLSRKHSK
ncbi:YibE/F family protein [Pelosinus fermentans]|uniref:YibE/F family protein n=1 Tax=Pelosinus fermentans JBW45 TaxID=1192197 RepID=I9DI68_9FIRM|nr:YibE/F family protein [Pelosinus fermentans]AJQ26387.1 YibE/F family protein [Pelosinus fermentans JBW45]